MHGAAVVGDTVLAVGDVAAGAVAARRTAWQAPVDDDYRLDADRADALFPVRVLLCAASMGRVGWLLLGPAAASTAATNATYCSPSPRGPARSLSSASAGPA